MVSALALAVSVAVAYRALREQLRAPARERRNKLYHALITAPAIDKLSAFQEAADGILREGESSIRLLRDGDPQLSTIEATSRAVASKFKACLDPIANSLLIKVRAWDDAKLTATMDDRLSEIEDSVVKGIDRLCKDGTVEPSLGDRLRIATADLLKTIARKNEDEVG